MCNNTQKKKAAGAGKDFTLFFGVMLHFNFKCADKGQLHNRLIMIFNERRGTLRGLQNKTSKQEWNNKEFTVQAGRK